VPARPAAGTRRQAPHRRGPAKGAAGDWAGGGGAPGAVASTAASSSVAPQTSSWPLLLKTDPAEWRPQLAYLISRHANHLDRWQLGDDDSDAFITDPDMRKGLPGRVPGVR